MFTKLHSVILILAGKENVGLHIHSSTRLRGVMLNYLSTGTNLPLPFKGNRSALITDKNEHYGQNS
jgi:hypothetical protein